MYLLDQIVIEHSQVCRYWTTPSNQLNGTIKILEMQLNKQIKETKIENLFNKVGVLSAEFHQLVMPCKEQSEVFTFLRKETVIGKPISMLRKKL